MSEAQMKYTAIITKLSGEFEGVKASKMFGMQCGKVNGKVFACFEEAGMIFKLQGKSHARALNLDGAKLFDPMGGRPMKEWVYIPTVHADQWENLAADALEYVMTITK